MKKKRKKNLLYRIWHWYIKGEYHCDKCPYCWAERTSYEYDEWDAGCYIKGDLPDGACRLLPPFRYVIGSLRKKKAEYYHNHLYDDFPEYMQEQDAKTEKIIELIEKLIGEFEICWKNENGIYMPIDTKAHLRYEAWRVRSDFEDFLREIYAKKNPYQNPWKKAVLWTWERFTRFFKPYFCK